MGTMWGGTCGLSPAGPMVGSLYSGGTLGSSKRMRMDGEQPLSGRAAPFVAPITGGAAQAAAATAAAVPPTPSPPSFVPPRAAFVPPAEPGIMRSPSLGSQIARAMPDQLRDLAIEAIVDDANGAVQAAPTEQAEQADDFEHYLWDFIETGQELEYAKP
jgi:hypothetical protein